MAKPEIVDGPEIRAIGPYSNAVKAGGLVFVSGQPGGRSGDGHDVRGAGAAGVRKPTRCAGGARRRHGPGGEYDLPAGRYQLFSRTECAVRGVLRGVSAGTDGDAGSAAARVAVFDRVRGYGGRLRQSPSACGWMRMLRARQRRVSRCSSRERIDTTGAGAGAEVGGAVVSPECLSGPTVMQTSTIVQTFQSILR